MKNEERLINQATVDWQNHLYVPAIGTQLIRWTAGLEGTVFFMTISLRSFSQESTLFTLRARWERIFLPGIPPRWWLVGFTVAFFVLLSRSESEELKRSSSPVLALPRLLPLGSSSVAVSLAVECDWLFPPEKGKSKDLKNEQTSKSINRSRGDLRSKLKS